MPSKDTASSNPAWEGVFSGAVGLWLALGLIKFGNPVILGNQLRTPENWEELVFQPWPMAWGAILLAIVFLLGLRFWRWRVYAPAWTILLPLVWFCWQSLSAAQTVNGVLTTATLKHFFGSLVAFYVGLFAFCHVRSLVPFWTGLFGGLVVVILVGWHQHFGGLAETRHFFYSLPDWKSYPPEFLKKVASDRIYSTLFYPNTLAGVIVLLAPPWILVLWQAARNWPNWGKLAATGTAGFAALASLYWSGSKAGWLIALAQAMVAFAHSRLTRRIKVLVLMTALALGLAGFGIKYRTYFQRGATSMSARFDYWRAAWRAAQLKPVLGSGPGTFMVSYKALKAPETEMARLAHNDFLQQASDSGLVGFFTYTAFILGSVWFLYRRSRMEPNAAPFGLWLGLLGICLHSVVEFGLYVPAISWPMFFFLGWLLGTTDKGIKSTSDPRLTSFPRGL